MKKVSIITLSLVMLMNGSIVFSAPKKANRRRNAVSTNTTSATTVNTTSSITLEELEAQNAVEELERSIQEEQSKEINDLISILNTNIEKAKSSCSGIKDELKAIQVLAGVSTGASGLGVIASETALAVGVTKATLDKEIAKTQSDLEKMSPAELEEELDHIEKQLSKDEKKSKTLGNARTGLLAGSIATSVTSTITSGISTKKLDDLIEKMKDCDKVAKQLQSNVSMIKAEIDDVNDLKNNQTFKNAENIAFFCQGLDSNNIKEIKKTLTASTVIGGIGTAVSTAGTITSAFANTDKVRNDPSKDGVKKEKDLNLASNIMAGISVGTSIGGTALSAISLSKLADDIDWSGKCEDALK